MSDQRLISRRSLLKATAAGAGFLALGGAGFASAAPIAQRLLLGGVGADSLYIEAWPTSPLILNPFTDELLIPQATRPVPQSVWSNWKHWKTGASIVPGPGAGKQDDMGQTHSVYPGVATKLDGSPNPTANYPWPLIYQIKLQVAQHSFTSSSVLPINSNGQPSISYGPGGATYAAGTVRNLPASTITGFNGNWSDSSSSATFPGPRINAAYGQPVILRFENHMDENPLNLGREDFGSP